MDFSPTLSLCMIVKNEEAWLAQCLESVKDLVNEMIVVDTGSSDQTIPIARSYGAKLYNLPWPDDFSKARNYSIAQSTQDWILVLDADETINIQDHAAIKSLIQTTSRDNEAFTLIQTNYSNDSTLLGWLPNHLNYSLSAHCPGYVDSPLVRLFRRKENLGFEGVVHEHVHATKSILTSIRIHHFGQLNPENVLSRKHQLYLDLLIKKTAQFPLHPHYWYELGVQYSQFKNYDQAIECVKKSIELDPQYSRALMTLGALYNQIEKYDEAIEAYLNALKIDEKNRDAYLYLPLLYLETKQLGKAELLFKQASHFVSDQPSYWINYGVFERNSGNYNGAIECFQKAIKINPHEHLAYFNLGMTYVLKGKWEEALKAFEVSVLSPNFKNESIKMLDQIQKEKGKTSFVSFLPMRSSL